MRSFELLTQSGYATGQAASSLLDVAIAILGDTHTPTERRRAPRHSMGMGEAGASGELVLGTSGSEPRGPT